MEIQGGASKVVRYNTNKFSESLSNRSFKLLQSSTPQPPEGGVDFSQGEVLINFLGLFLSQSIYRLQNLDLHRKQIPFNRFICYA